METPPKISHHFSDWLWDFAELVMRNSFGFLTFLAGLVYQFHQMMGKSRRLKRSQCILSVILWAISGITVVIALDGIEINKLIYGIICWATPIVIKPFADKVAEHAPNLADKLLVWLESFIDKKSKEK